MKFTYLSLATMAWGLVTPVFGKPANHSHRRVARGQAGLQKRWVQLTVTDSRVLEPTELPQAVVWVDQFGNRLRLTTENVMFVPVPTGSPDLDAGSEDEDVDVDEPTTTSSAEEIVGPTSFVGSSFPSPTDTPDLDTGAGDDDFDWHSTTTATTTSTTTVTTVVVTPTDPIESSFPSPTNTPDFDSSNGEEDFDRDGTTLSTSTLLAVPTNPVESANSSPTNEADVDTGLGDEDSLTGDPATSTPTELPLPTDPVESSVSSPTATTGTTTGVADQTPTGAGPTASAPPAAGERTSPGIAYAPYSASGHCKTAEQMASDLSILKQEYSLVRIYGTDCDQVAKIYPAAKDAGVKLFLGLFELENVAGQVQHIVEGVDGDWDTVDTVSVGNERVNRREATAEEVISAVSEARRLLRAAGYWGPVVTVDTFVAVINHPELCDESDYCAVNIHPFFDGNTAADGAGPFVTRMVGEVRSRLADKSTRVVVTESGWPWQGTNNGAAVPGRKEQHVAIESIKEAFADNPQDLILFSAFNDPWKKPAAKTFYAEQYWGVNALDSAY